MKRPLIFVQDPNALKNWLSACGTDAKVLYELTNLQNRYSAESNILLIQVSDKTSAEQIIKLAQDYDIIAFSNSPTDFEGLQLFQNGIKGYLNTFATIERIAQAVSTVQAGSVWLGQSVMQAMIESLAKQNKSKDEWKESLTDREQQTTALVLERKTNKEIAHQLEITERTVKAHLHNVFEKLQVTDRLSLVLKINNWT